MNYDRILLELMNRVAALEEEVKALKANRAEWTEDEQVEDNFTVGGDEGNSVFDRAVYGKNRWDFSIGRDTTKYILDGVRYAKNRLVLAIVKKYVAQNPSISADELMTAFDKSLQGSLGVVRTLKDAESSYIDYRRRFFTEEHEVIHTTTEDCVVCSQWGASNIGNMIVRAKTLGIEVIEI